MITGTPLRAHILRSGWALWWVFVYTPSDRPPARGPSRRTTVGDEWVREWVEIRHSKRAALRAVRRIAGVLESHVEITYGEKP